MFYIPIYAFIIFCIFVSMLFGVAIYGHVYVSKMNRKLDDIEKSLEQIRES